MGRIGEVITRTWQTAHKMKVQRGQLKEDEELQRGIPSEEGDPLIDNYRAKRYVAKYTINPNASIPTPQPVMMRPQWTAKGALAAAAASCVFVSKTSVDTVKGYGVKKAVVPVSNCRGLTKKDMKLNFATPKITVDPETYRVTADGEVLECEPMD